MRHRQKELGFTLIEALVALTVLSIGLIGAYSAATSSLFLATSIRNSMIASGLAQEGIEVVRAIRDANWFQDNPFDQGLGSGDYLVTWDATTLTPFSDTPIKIDANGIYQYAGGANTLFKRKVSIVNSANGRDLSVVSEVIWRERQRDRSVRAELRLFNWK